MPTSVSVKRYYYINYQILFYIEMLAWRTCIVIYSYPKNPHSIRISSEDHRQFDIKFNVLILHVLRTQHLTITHFSDAATEESMSVDEDSSECYWWVSALNGSLCITLHHYTQSTLYHNIQIMLYHDMQTLHRIMIYKSHCIMIYELHSNIIRRTHCIIICR